MHTAAYSILHDKNDVEDILHDCWMSWCNPRDLKKIRKLYQNQGSDLRQFVAGCIRNKCYTLLRGNKKRMERMYENEDHLADANMAALTPSLEETVALRHEVREAYEGIHALPPYQRQLMKMRYIDEQTTSEIAIVTGMTINAINAILSKAKKRLKLDIKAEEDIHGEAV